MRIPPPDPLTTILLYLSAIQMALNAALAPGTPIATAHPGLTMAGIWPYVPLVLLGLATIIWIVRGWGRPPNTEVVIRHDPGAQAAPVVKVVQPGPVPPREPWHAKLNGYQMYLLIYAAMFFVYEIAQLVVGHKK
jgi:hypothetical protein